MGGPGQNLWSGVNVRPAGEMTLDMPPRDLGAGFVPRPRLAEGGQVEDDGQPDPKRFRTGLMQPPIPPPPSIGGFSTMPDGGGCGFPEMGKVGGTWTTPTTAPSSGLLPCGGKGAMGPDSFAAKSWAKGKVKGGMPASVVLPPARPPGPDGWAPGVPAPVSNLPLPMNSTFPGLMPPQFAVPGAGDPLPPADGAPRLVLLAPITASIIPVSSKQRGNKEIAMQFVNADKETQTRMLRDPSVARAILQTLAESPQQAGGGVGQMVSQLGRTLGSAGAALPGMPAQAGGQGAAAWSGAIMLARNMGKRIGLRASMVHGKVQDVEVALRSAAGNSGVLDITHRVPFEEIARRANGTILALSAPSPAEQPQFEEYVKYFRTKMRAGVARIDGSLVMYVLPPAEDIPAIRDSVYVLGTHIPRTGCLLGLIAQGSAAAPAQAPAATAPGKQAAAPASAAPEKAAGSQQAPQSAKQAGGGAAAPAAAPADSTATVTVGKGEGGSTAPAAEEDGGGLPVSSKELLDLFSNPELIKLLSDEGDSKGS